MSSEKPAGDWPFESFISHEELLASRRNPSITAPPASETATEGEPIMTPSATIRSNNPTIVDGNEWNGLSLAVPWPGSVFIIVEQTTGKAIAVKNGKAAIVDHQLQQPLHAINSAASTRNSIASSGSSSINSDKSKHWFCVEKDGHFGFQNQATGRYMGHDGNHGIRVNVNHLRNWEYVVVRKHPQGGYQMLVMHDKSSALRVVSVNEAGDGLVTREHGPTLWEFYKV